MSSISLSIKYVLWQRGGTRGWLGREESGKSVECMFLVNGEMGGMGPKARLLQCASKTQKGFKYV